MDPVLPRRPKKGPGALAVPIHERVPPFKAPDPFFGAKPTFTFSHRRARLAGWRDFSVFDGSTVKLGELRKDECPASRLALGPQLHSRDLRFNRASFSLRNSRT